jgi:hypothetical protein
MDEVRNLRVVVFRDPIAEANKDISGLPSGPEEWRGL